MVVRGLLVQSEQRGWLLERDIVGSSHHKPTYLASPSAVGIFNDAWR